MTSFTSARKDSVLLVSLSAVLLMVLSSNTAKEVCSLNHAGDHCKAMCVCNFTSSIWQDKYNFDVYCTSPIEEKLLTCLWYTDTKPHCGQCDSCTYNITSEGLIMGFDRSREELGQAPCQVKLAETQQSIPCRIEDDNTDSTTAQPSPTADTRSSIRIMSLPTEQAYSGDRANTVGKLNPWNPLSAGMTAAVGGLLIVQCVVVFLWCRDKQRLKAKYMYPTVGPFQKLIQPV